MITDELREYASSLAMKAGASTTEVKGALEEIADRIDQEHEEEVFDLLREHDEWVHDRDANYIQLPKDADGEYIHIGDELEYKYGRFVVSQLTFYVVDGKKGLFWSSDDPIKEEWVGLSGQCGVPLARHVQPDSWERIIADAAATRGDFDELVARCKRLAGENA